MNVRAHPPYQFCSKGLERALVRLGFLGAKDSAQLSTTSPHLMVIAALAEAGKGSEEKILAALAKDLAVPKVELKGIKMLERIRKSALLGVLDERFMVERRCIATEKTADHVTVAMADPLDIETIGQLEFSFAAKVKVALARESEILQVIERLLGLHETDASASDPVAKSAADLDLEASLGNDPLSDEVGSATAPVIRFVNQILVDAHAAHASDIHLEPGAASLDVRYRIDGVMTPQLSIPKRLQSYVIARVKILSGMDITEKRRPQDGRFRIRAGGNDAVDLRASTVPTQHGEKIVLRLLRSDIADLSLEALKLPPAIEAGFRDALKARDRIVLVCGPTGSGKTTTLYSAVQDLRQGTTNIITVEDPVEIRIEGVSQIQVDAKIGMTFASGLRSILRQDPDIILVGEIRDLETADTAFQAAQTGHLVLSTLHTNTAASAVVRLMDLGLEPFIIASSLGAVLAQRLVRKVCPDCAVPDTDSTLHIRARRFGLDASSLRKGAGCEHCEQTGYRGRAGVYSLLVVDSVVREMIRSRASEAQIIQAAKSRGMRELFESALDLVAQGVTTLDEIERVIGLSEAIDSGVAGRTNSVKAKEPLAPELAAIETTEKGSIEKLAEEYRKHERGANDRKRILLVDDDEGVRAVMSRVLRKADFDVCEASNGYDALDKFGEFAPDIVVSDLVMPGLSGKDLVEELRRDENTAQIPILMLTGSDDEENEIELIRLGASDFVSKTSSPMLVITRIKRLLKSL